MKRISFYDKPPRAPNVAAANVLNAQATEGLHNDNF